MQAKIEIVESKFFAATVAEEICALINESIAERASCSLVLAGGSTPAGVYRALAMPPYVTEVKWEKVSLFWGDERFVPKDDLQSNFRMVNETLLSRLPAAGPKVFAVETDNISAKEAAKKYAALLQSQLTQAKESRFDLVLLGMGEDGHTASLFPGVCIPQSELCFATLNPNDKSERISLTPQALFSARKIIFLVSGENKAEMLKKVLAAEGDKLTLPARHYEAARERVSCFVDSAAASQLKI